jgi:preprotein translocase subunit YajC
MDLLVLVALLAIMYFLLIRPQQQRAKRQRQLVESLQAGDEIVTAGGLIGTIRIIDDVEMRVEVGPGVEVRLVRGAVTKRLGPNAPDVVDLEDPEP